MLDLLHNLYLRNLLVFMAGSFSTFLFFYGACETYARTKAQPEAQRLTCQELIDNGPGANGHIVLTNYSLDIAHRTKVASSSRNDAWLEAWVPVFPASQQVNQPTSFRVVLLSARAIDRPALEEIQAQGEVEGTIVNYSQSFTPAAAKDLRGPYPDTNFDQCIIILHGYAPQSTAMIVSMFIGSLFFALAAVNLFIFCNFRRPHTKA